MDTQDIRQEAATHPFWSLVSVGENSICWPWAGPLDKSGYGYQGKERAHRIAWERFYQKSLRANQVIRHRCDNPICCNPLHLLSGGHQDNVNDRVKRDRSAKGETNGRSKLTEAQVLQIYKAAGSYAEIGEKFEVSKWSVRDIKTGKNWGWLTSVSHGGKF